VEWVRNTTHNPPIKQQNKIFKLFWQNSVAHSYLHGQIFTPAGAKRMKFFTHKNRRVRRVVGDGQSVR
jgi:hypothetical protein